MDQRGRPADEEEPDVWHTVQRMRPNVSTAGPPNVSTAGPPIFSPVAPQQYFPPLNEVTYYYSQVGLPYLISIENIVFDLAGDTTFRFLGRGGTPLDLQERADLIYILELQQQRARAAGRIDILRDINRLYEVDEHYLSTRARETPTSLGSLIENRRGL